MRTIHLLMGLLSVATLLPLLVNLKLHSNIPNNNAFSAVSMVPRHSYSSGYESFPNPTGRCDVKQFDWKSNYRKNRFPSVEERVCLYMTRWYDPKYKSAKQWKSPLSYKHDNQTDKVELYWNGMLAHTIQLENYQIVNDSPFYLFRNNLTLVQESMVFQKIAWLLMIFYASETVTFCEKFPFSFDAPILFSWGDQQIHDMEDASSQHAYFPTLAKWRFNNITEHGSNPVPILIPLEGGKHYGPLKDVTKHDTIPWDQKQNIAIWRGDMSGIIDGKFHYDHDFKNEPLQTCLIFPRCRMVYTTLKKNESLADVGFTSCSSDELRHIEGIGMMKPKKPMPELLKYKMLISVEGNDVATGLKWNLLSSSVVLMPPPKKSIFSMEFLLQPWVHYVPIENVENLEEPIQWVLDHDEEAQQISKRATNFIQDLFFHPDAEADNDAVLQRIADRISNFWDESNE
eukprot:CAMPEP_0194211816 /NCGR_PEP_ID=MMETSP0156-20130528/11229_1 /TAXON_ID=33649 /ORGANISM="Thalassionema nitzschioides, Strain L26-B" /LENGTH=456 /DNA_ID=CAMNT_0038939495 /DNA_START=1 /DNA_END=1371 /DNA_ORIENTATION=+